MMRAASIPGPTASIVTLEDLKDHLRVDGDDEDALISAAGLSATAYVEKWTQRLLSPRTAVLRLAALPLGASPLPVPGGVVNSITGLTVDGAAVTGLTAVGDSPAVIVPDADWPVATGAGFPVVLTYNAGYAAAPVPLLFAVRLIAAELFEQRRQGTDKPMGEAPISAEYLMRPYRIWPI